MDTLAVPTSIDLFKHSISDEADDVLQFIFCLVGLVYSSRSLNASARPCALRVRLSSADCTTAIFTCYYHVVTS